MLVMSDLAFGKTYELAAAAIYVAKRWPGAQLVEAPTYADLDWLVVKPQEKGPNKLISFLEVKTRRIHSKKYNSTIVAYRKHDAARLAKAFFKVGSVCLILFTNDVATFDLHDIPDGKQIIGRYDRPGKGVVHALYHHHRFDWHPELLDPILACAKAL